MSVRILVGDCRDQLRTLADESVHTCICSPPYFGLRDYDVDGQIGLEDNPDAFVAELVAVFREVRRVLRDDGTLWLNLGDSYANDSKWGGATSGKHVRAQHGASGIGRRRHKTGLKSKDLMGIPWRVAFALQTDGWFLRQDIIWHKPNVMPESVSDRCTKAHEYIFLLSKSPSYYYNADAILEPASPGTHARVARNTSASGSSRANGGTRPDRPMKAVLRSKKTVANAFGARNNESFSNAVSGEVVKERNKRSVWTVQTASFSEAHFATYPEALIAPCVLAGAPEGGVVLDPFGGAGTTGLAASRLGRDAILIELNPAYAAMAQRRLKAALVEAHGADERAGLSETPLFGSVA